MKTRRVFLTVLLASFCGCAIANPVVQLPPEGDPAAVKAIMTKVADWQLANPSRHHPADWTHGAMYAGMAAWAHMAETDTYYDAMRGVGERNSWQPHRRIYHADDHVVGIMYLEMYKRFNEAKMKQGIQDRFDTILANPSTRTLEFKKARDAGLSYGGAFHGEDRWWWCDALFMAPPVLAKLATVTGDRRYLDFMDQEWWLTTDYLYDTEEHLYFRDDRFFDQREANDQKVFWSRGNGWVFGGLAMVLEELPDDYPSRRRYEQLFREMSARLIAIQPEDGMWRASLLDPDSYPVRESSGTGFFTYGLAWGINNGYLDTETYLPAVMKAWQGLVGNVHPDGKLGFVQQIGDDPRHTTADQTEVYGVGAFLLAGSEVYQLAMRHTAQATTVEVTNPLIQFRQAVTVSIDWDDVKAIPGMTKDSAGVFDFKHKRFLVTQAVDNNADGSIDELLFQMDLAPGERRRVWLMNRPDAVAAATAEAQAFGRFVPERMDDYAWENDRIAFRMYGKALEVEMVSVGIDAWGKRVSYPIIDKWYAHGDYHTDHGEGLDYYAVGRTLGCAGMAPVHNGQLVPSRNFHSAKRIASGPIRTIFELHYEPWNVGGVQVSHVKRVSLDLGSNLNRFECRIACQGADRITLAAGIVVRDQDDIKLLDAVDGLAAYWEPADPQHGRMGMALVFEDPQAVALTEMEGHLLGLSEQSCREPFVYYGGACWEQVAMFDSFDKWTAYLRDFATSLRNPVHVRIQ